MDIWIYGEKYLTNKTIIMKVNVKRLFNQKGVETGAILSITVGGTTNIQQKYAFESQLIQYGFDILYPGEGLNIFRDMYIDTPSVTIIKNINDIDGTEVTI